MKTASVVLSSVCSASKASPNGVQAPFFRSRRPGRVLWVKAKARSDCVASPDRSVLEALHMSYSQPPLSNPGLLGRVLDWVRTRCGSGNELAGMSPAELRDLASDLSLSESDLQALSTSLNDNTALMEGMMRARGFEPDLLRHSFGLLIRDVERVCSRCRATGQCRRELDAGTAASHAHEYCPNAGTFDDLVDYATSG